MQTLVASRLKHDEKCINGLGNWSDTGTGKTLSALLSIRHLECRTAIIFCPKTLTEQWETKTKEAFAGVFDINY